MTKMLCRTYYREIANDPDIFMDMSRFSYNNTVRCAVIRFGSGSRIWEESICCDAAGSPIGEVILKNIDNPNRSCVMSIHLQNDSVKNRGYGTQAEVLALQYAFHEMQMETVYADAIKQNQRSRHVLEKVGFRMTHHDDDFVYYRCDRERWTPPIL